MAVLLKKGGISMTQRKLVFYRKKTMGSQEPLAAANAGRDCRSGQVSKKELLLCAHLFCVSSMRIRILSSFSRTPPFVNLKTADILNPSAGARAPGGVSRTKKRGLNNERSKTWTAGKNG
jgi:hypothetical protein